MSKIIKYVIKRIRYGFKKSKIMSIHISNKSKIGNNVVIEKNVIVNRNTQIGDFTYVCSNSSIYNAKIGKFCSIASGVHIGEHNHPLNFVTTHPILYSDVWAKKINMNPLINFDGHKSIVIGNDVWIGRNVIIQGNVTIGDGSVIAAGAVVTKDVSPYSIVGGVPAKIIKYRFDELKISRLVEIKWWDESIEVIKMHYKEMYNIDEFIKNKERDK